PDRAWVLSRSVSRADFATGARPSAVAGKKRTGPFGPAPGSRGADVLVGARDRGPRAALQSRLAEPGRCDSLGRDSANGETTHRLKIPFGKHRVSALRGGRRR